MRKSGVVVLIILVLMVSLISVSLVSAGLLEFWDKITGKVTENVTEPDCPPGVPISRWCPDETTLCPMTTDEQGCSVWDCDACEPEPPEPEKEICCKITKGLQCPIGYPCPPPEVSYEQRLEKECAPVPAPAADDSYEIVADGYCEESPPDKECEEGDEKYYVCDDGTKIPECECESGGWVCKISPEEDCPDTRPPETCAASIKITFNKDSYKLGDPIKIIVETFDSQGNHLPNYDFYGQMYDDRWHTPDLKKTDSEGYFIHTGIAADKPPEGVTEVKFKVYTKETSSCGSVEDTAEVKVELGECGIGGCDPDPGCKDKIRMCGGKCPPCPEDDGDGEIFYPCSGCELENKCYPMGYRKVGEYCSDNYEFVNQIEEGKCDNSFECKSNVCVSGECIGEGLIKKIIAWFSKLFGGDGDEEPKDCSKILIEEDIGDSEYNQSLYGVSKETQAPLFSDDCEQMGVIKCCVAQYIKNGNNEMGLMCPYDNREEVENLVRCGLAGTGIVLEEYNGEEVIKMEDGKMMIWTHKNYVLAVGKMPEAGIPEEVADAYLKKYKSDLGDIDIIPYIPDIEPKPFEFCTEEDREAAKECHERGGAGQSDPSTFEGTVESKESCKVHGEGCCEVYTGCIMPDEDCEEIKIVSRDECYWHVARLNQDADLCEKISDSYYKDKCLREVVTATQDPTGCEKITDIIEKEDCYVWNAIENNDAFLCEGISWDTLQRNKCYIHVSQHTGDAGICENVDDSSLQEKCYFWVAEQEGDVGVCEEMEDSSLQAECYVYVAEKTGDASFCDKIADSHIGDKCYRDVGIQTNDRSLCEKIIEDKAKQKCLDNTS